ncbi:MAG: chorismate synthase, partial [Bacilli bacterium]
MISLQNKMPIRVFGGSHDDHIGLILSQFPAGVVLDLQAISMNLAKRVAFKTGSSTRCEVDQIVI